VVGVAPKFEVKGRCLVHASLIWPNRDDGASIILLFPRQTWKAMAIAVSFFGLGRESREDILSWKRQER